jgi:hypothetical protein
MSNDATLALSGFTPEEKAVVSALVDTVDRCSRMIATIEAMKASTLARLAALAHDSGARSANGDGIDYARRAMAAEVAAATRIHPASAKRAMEEAEELTQRYPETHAALGEGLISAKHARVVIDAGALLEPDARAAFDVSTAPIAASTTPGDLSRIARKRAAEVAELSPLERHRAARVRRFVSITDRDDGMSDLRVFGPSLELHAIYDRATRLAQIVKRDRTRVREEYRRAAGHPADAECADKACACRDPRATAQDDAARQTPPASADDATAIAATDHRTLDQIRTDILVDVLLGAEPTGHELHASGTDAVLTNVRAEVQITIPATMILDPADGAAWLDAGTLISPDTARAIAGTAPGWDRLFYRPDTGQVEHLDHYRPSAWQKRALIGRDLTCRFPGCTTPARRADIDHTHAFADGGKTTMSNLACLCEAHHVMKHQSDWRMRQLDDGVVEWISPAGNIYEAEPPSRVFFREDPPPAVRDLWEDPPPPDPDDPPTWAAG